MKTGENGRKRVKRVLINGSKWVQSGSKWVKICSREFKSTIPGGTKEDLLKNLHSMAQQQYTTFHRHCALQTGYSEKVLKL